VEENLKPIYEREVWKVLKQAADELGLAVGHCEVKKDLALGCRRHISQAEKIITDFVLKDMKRAEQCQRKGESPCQR